MGDMERRADGAKIEKLFDQVAGISIQIAVMGGKIDSLCSICSEIKEWQRDHIGKTHDVVDKRLSHHSMRLWIIVGGVAVLAWILSFLK